MFPIRDHNPSEKTPYVTFALIAINVAVFLIGLVVFQTNQDINWLYFHYAMIPDRIVAGENLPSLVSSVFLHAGLMHLAGNMLFLWIFGDNMEEALGHTGFLLFYLASGIGANLAQVLADPLSPIPTVGASGAIAGVMGAYLLFFPKARVDIFLFFIVFFRILPIPAWIMLGLWFGLQLVSGVGSSAAGGGVAYWAHAGGFVIGAVLAFPAWTRRGGAGFWARTEGHPPHPPATYPVNSNIPVVRRRK